MICTTVVRDERPSECGASPQGVTPKTWGSWCSYYGRCENGESHDVATAPCFGVTNSCMRCNVQELGVISCLLHSSQTNWEGSLIDHRFPHRSSLQMESYLFLLLVDAAKVTAEMAFAILTLVEFDTVLAMAIFIWRVKFTSFSKMCVISKIFSFLLLAVCFFQNWIPLYCATLKTIPFIYANEGTIVPVRRKSNQCTYSTKEIIAWKRHQESINKLA